MISFVLAHLDWLTTAMGLGETYLLTKKRAGAWVVQVARNLIWIVIALDRGMYGLLIGTLIAITLGVYGFVQWRRETGREARS